MWLIQSVWARVCVCLSWASLVPTDHNDSWYAAGRRPIPTWHRTGSDCIGCSNVARSDAPCAMTAISYLTAAYDCRQVYATSTFRQVAIVAFQVGG